LHVIGINFKSAKLDRVARVQWPDRDCISPFLEEVRARFGLSEAFFLQTCNRREFYFDAPHLDSWPDAFFHDFLAALSASIGSELDPADFYRHSGLDVASHLFRVASSLDSMVLGETEIMKQIKDQARAGRKSGHLGRRLNALVDAALWTAKQVRMRTNINKNVVSIASLAYRKVKRHTAQSARKRVVLVGAGHFIWSIAPTFAKAPELELIFVNRSLPTGLAEQYGGRAMTLADFLAEPPPFEALISATGAPAALFDASWLNARTGRLLLIDAALPRDIDPAAAELDHVEHADLDQLEAILQRNRASRESEIPKAEPIFREGLQRLEAALLECDLAQYHREISAHYRETGEKALAYLLKQRLPNLDDTQAEALRQWTQSLVGKLTSVPILGLKGVARELGEDAVTAYTRNVAKSAPLFKP